MNTASIVALIGLFAGASADSLAPATVNITAPVVTGINFTGFASAPIPSIAFPAVPFNLTVPQHDLKLLPNLAFPSWTCLKALEHAVVASAESCIGLSALISLFIKLITEIPACIASYGISCLNPLSIYSNLCSNTCPLGAITPAANIITEGCAKDLAANNLPIVLLQSVVASFNLTREVLCVSKGVNVGIVTSCFKDVIETFFQYAGDFIKHIHFWQLIDGELVKDLFNGKLIKGFFSFLPKTKICTECSKDIVSLLASVSAINITGNFLFHNLVQFGETCGVPFLNATLHDIHLPKLNAAGPEEYETVSLQGSNQLFHTYEPATVGALGNYLSNPDGGIHAYPGSTSWEDFLVAAARIEAAYQRIINGTNPATLTTRQVSIGGRVMVDEE